MSLFRVYTRLAIFLVMLVYNGAWLFSQQVVDGSRLAYTHINSIRCSASNDPDTLFVISTAAFSVNDTVMVYQAVGASIYPPAFRIERGY